MTGTLISTTILESPLGTLVAGVLDNRICLLEFNDPIRLDVQYAVLRRLYLCDVESGTHPLHQILKDQLEQYFAGKRQVFSLPLCYSGSEFQKSVWQALLEIPYGETRSYADIALRIGAPNAARAVGAANGSNHLVIVVPCHRVVSRNGGLAGYGGGVWRKKWLLDMEQRFRAR